MARSNFLRRFMQTEIFSDDFNFFWSAIFLALPAIIFLVVRLLFIQSAITCEVPTRLQQKAYWHETCWEQPTYEAVPDIYMQSAIERKVTSPHAWIPYMLLIMLLLFTIPQGINHVAKRLFTASQPIVEKGSDGGKSAAAEIAQSIHYSTSQTRMTIVLLVIKFMILLNLVLHLLYIKVNFKDKTLVTYQQVDNNVTSHEHTYPAFPRKLTCLVDEYRQQRSSVEKYSFNCIFPINNVYEKYMTLLSLWFALAAVVTIVGFANNVAFCYVASYTKFVLSRYLPKEDIVAVLTQTQGTDALLQLRVLCKTEELSLVRDVTQLLRELIKTTISDEDTEELGEDNSPPIPEIVIEPAAPVEQLEVEESDVKV